MTLVATPPSKNCQMTAEPLQRDGELLLDSSLWEAVFDSARRRSLQTLSTYIALPPLLSLTCPWRPLLGWCFSGSLVGPGLGIRLAFMACNNAQRIENLIEQYGDGFFLCLGQVHKFFCSSLRFPHWRPRSLPQSQAHTRTWSWKIWEH